MSEEFFGDYMNYIIHIPHTPDNQSMDTFVLAKAEEQYVSNSLFNGGFNSVTCAHVMDKVIESEVSHPQMAGSKGSSCAMPACDGKGRQLKAFHKEGNKFGRYDATNINDFRPTAPRNSPGLVQILVPQDECRLLARDLPNLKFNWVRRSANQVAHILAKTASSLHSIVDWSHFSPSFIANELLTDLINE
ncbi:beta-1 [Forsythia ovata]|uniref:Beta-1 n=1 Tax=Forsythia ovata TaxID=205694 RepID=A0ABD1UU00_9LAMI